MAVEPEDLDIPFELRHLRDDDTVPSLKDLHQHIAPRYARQWREIGTLLGLSSAALDTIEHNRHCEARQCCCVMLFKWLEVDPTASWRKLFTVIELSAVSCSAPHIATPLTSKLDQLTITDKGTRLAEYEVFIQYYDKLMISLKNRKALLLFNEIFDNDDFLMIWRYNRMVTRKEVSLSETEFSEDSLDYETGMLLAKIAMKLHFYNTEPFYKMLEFMQYRLLNRGAQLLATEILTKVKELDPLMSSKIPTKVRESDPPMSSGPKLLEFDLFMKYYNRFAGVIQSSRNIHMLAVAEIITEDERELILYGGIGSFSIIVLKTIHHLLSGDTSYFYKLQYCDDKLATKIRTEDYIWKQKISTGTDCPTLDGLHKLAIPLCATQWKYIGRRLNFTPTTLKAIHDGNHGDDSKCCDALFSKWLDTDPQATWEKLIFAIDTKSPEYEVFIQYYDKLMPSLKNCTDQLHHCCWEIFSSPFNRTIRIYVDEVITKDATKAGILLARIAMKLYYDNTYSFYRMLNFMKSYEGDPGVQQLAAEIHAKVEEFDPLMSSGSLPNEFDVLMKYYNHLTELLPNNFDYSIFVKAKIITDEDKDFISRQKGGFEIILIKTLNHLLSGDTDSFYQLLDNLKYIPNGDKVTCRIQTEIKLFTARYFCSVEEKCPISKCKLLSKTFDHHGGELMIKEHDVTIAVPKLAVFEGVKVEIQAAASLTGPYKLPDDCNLVSVFVWIGANYRFKKSVKIIVPHFAYIEGLVDYRMVILTANEKDIVHKEDGNYLVQMHESVYDYQYVVNDDCCVYYTDHFCSKCYMERSFIYNLYNTLVLSPLKSLLPFKRRLMVFFCYPKDHKTADELNIEFCICYSLKYCLQTVCERYKQKNVILKQATWNITINKWKNQYFYLSYNECPGWKIQLIGNKKKNVNDLEFWNYSIENLIAEEERCEYPPRFQVTVTYLKKHKKNLDTKFKIALETDGVLALDDGVEFPLLILIESANIIRLDQHFTIDDGSVPASNVTTIVDTTKNTTCTSDTDISNLQLTANVNSTLTTTTAATATIATITTSTSSTSVVSGTSMIDPPEVRYLNKYVRDPLCAAGPNKWRDLGLILIGESNRSKLGMIKIDEKHGVSGCCDAMFARWLEIDPEPSWNKLIAALKEISLKAIAEDLTKILS